VEEEEEEASRRAARGAQGLGARVSPNVTGGTILSLALCGGYFGFFFTGITAAPLSDASGQASGHASGKCPAL
jgi:hypothetical protein